jgi:hypothetical protein
MSLPVSITVISKVLVFEVNLLRKLIPSVYVNLIALFNKLYITCLILVGPATITLVKQNLLPR